MVREEKTFKFEIGYKLDWGTTSFKLLGINFSVDLKDIPGLNYTPALKIINKSLTNWQRRNLTPIGKIAVIKIFVISILTHMFSAIPPPSRNVIIHLNQLFYSFIWNDKAHEISHKQAPILTQGQYFIHT